MVRFRIRAHQLILHLPTLPGFEDRKLVQQPQPNISNVTSAAKLPQFGLASKRRDCSVSGRSPQQIHNFQMRTKGQIRYTGISDILLPAKSKAPQLRQVLQNRKTFVGDRSLP